MHGQQGGLQQIPQQIQMEIRMDISNSVTAVSFIALAILLFIYQEGVSIPLYSMNVLVLL